MGSNIEPRCEPVRSGLWQLIELLPFEAAVPDRRTQQSLSGARERTHSAGEAFEIEPITPEQSTLGARLKSFSV